MTKLLQDTPEPLWRKLVKQGDLEKMYDTLKARADRTEQEIAFALARYAEACIFGVADRHIEAELATARARIAQLEAAATPALDWIDEIYPASVFDGSSGDEGPVRIVAIRENLRRALEVQT